MAPTGPSSCGGIYHGLLLALERVFRLNYTQSSPLPVLHRTTTICLVIFGWVIFRAENLDAALSYYEAMFALNGWGLDTLMPHLSPESLLVICLGMLSVLFPGTFSGSRWLVTAAAYLPCWPVMG